MKSQQEINEINKRRMEQFAKILIAEKAEKEARQKAKQSKMNKSKIISK